MERVGLILLAYSLVQSTKLKSLNVQYFLPVSSCDLNVDVGKRNLHPGVGDTSLEAHVTVTNVDRFYINAVEQKLIGITY